MVSKFGPRKWKDGALVLIYGPAARCLMSLKVTFFLVSEDNYWSQYCPRSFTELLLWKFTVGWLVPYIITQEFEAYCFHKQKSQKLGSCSHQDLYRFSNAVSHSLTKHRNSQKLTPMCTKSPLMQAIFVTGFVTQKHMAKCDTLT